MKKSYYILFLITLFMFVFIISANVNFFDFDLWARLVAGMGVIDGHTVLKQDFLSYTPTHTWWDHEYGSGAIFYILLKHFGAYSLIIFQACIIFLIFFFITKIINIRGVKSPYNFIFYMFPLISVSTNFASPIRCHLFSFLFFTIFIYILEKARRGNFKVLYILPVLTIIWNNLHGGVVAGLGIIFLYFLGELFDKKQTKHYIISEILCLFSLIINPWGYEYIQFLFMANTMQRPDVVEWLNIFSKIHLYKHIPFKIFIILIIMLETYKITKCKENTNIIEQFKNTDKVKFIVLLTTLFLSIKHVKMIPFFAITGTIYCYEDFSLLIEKKLPEYTSKLVLFVMSIICIFSLTVKKYEIPIGTSVYPHRELEFIKANNLKGNLLINFGLGSFAAYKLYPDIKIYVDGRYEEVYYDSEVSLLKKFYLVQEGWDEILKKYPPDIIIIEKYYPIFQKLTEEPLWINIYETENFAVFTQKDLKKEHYIEPDNNPEYYKNTLFDTSLKF